MSRQRCFQSLLADSNSWKKMRTRSYFEPGVERSCLHYCLDALSSWGFKGILFLTGVVSSPSVQPPMTRGKCTGRILIPDPEGILPTADLNHTWCKWAIWRSRQKVCREVAGTRYSACILVDPAWSRQCSLSNTGFIYCDYLAVFSILWQSFCSPEPITISLKNPQLS